jgi:hypothetical protein
MKGNVFPCLQMTDFCGEYNIPIFLIMKLGSIWLAMLTTTGTGAVLMGQTSGVSLCDQKICVMCHYCYMNTIGQLLRDY